MRKYHEKKCSCGCGEMFIPTKYRQQYKDGHAKNIPEDKDDLRNDFISGVLHHESKPRHEFEGYAEKDTEGKQLDSVCVRAFMSAGQIALRELGMTSLTIEKNGYKYKIKRNDKI